ncbi:DUF4349 domain-containing protein [Urbifossiella limnaea]|uniref:DUF4349 domain-containing protein n=1 Tax=Urbifossiella limnaea TaxID=2528023 RepID=A0A517XXV2_9BACT|nr:DUF4349 domain-containing protein [Urbifossiella limnaea]QDU22342.1 hypothetical protein ETAA1_43200 [Urbifossiella limnaea]
MIPAEPPVRPPAAAARGSARPFFVVFGVTIVLLIVGGVFLATSTKHAFRESFSFVGSAIKPTSASSPPAPDRAAREAAPAGAVFDPLVAAQAPVPVPAGQPKAEPVDRKIVYTAQLDLVVKNLDAADKQVDELLTANGGRLVSSESRGDAGSKRTATFKLEVPAGKFRAFMSALRPLGVPERDKVDSDDLTDEFVDIQIRVKHLKAEEDNLLKLLTERARSVEESLAIRRQMLPIREQIEKAEGRQKYIEAKAAFSTVTLKLREEANYVPPTADPPPTPPTFGDRVAATFGGSWSLLVTVGEWIALVGVAVAPWLPFVVPLAFAGVWVSRRRAGRATPPA